MNAGMNYGEDELGSFGDENEIKVSRRVSFYLLYALAYVSIPLKNSTFSNHHSELPFELNDLVQSLIFIFSLVIFLMIT